MSNKDKKWLLASVGIVLYSSLIFAAPIVKNWCWRYFNLQEVLQYAFGYFFAVILGHFPIRMVQSKAWEPLLATDKKLKDRWVYRPQYGAIIGIVERILYVACLQIGKPEFIPIWIGIKIAGGWSGWQDKMQGHDVFCVVLLGNAISLVYGFWGYQLTKWFYEDTYKLLVVCLTGVLVLGCWYIRYYLNQAQKLEMDIHKRVSTTDELISELEKSRENRK
jgi:cbb3-type cytochrome oxidase subunit 1